MIYLSAQPATFYFKWQLEVQLFNFSRLGIKREDIHVLFGYQDLNEIDPRITAFASANTLAQFFFYKDTRPKNLYESTIRPHIIKQHFDRFPSLSNESVFYHDSDIIFREVPSFDYMLKDDLWYFSNTDSYIGVNHLKSCGVDLFHEMCDILDVGKEKISALKISGGAQGLIKNTNSFFWECVERDSSNLYNYLHTQIYRLEKDYNNTVENSSGLSFANKIQPWCADMWSLLWNGVKFGHKITVDPELDFCWPSENIGRWEECKIFHNAGVTEENAHILFHKADFNNKSPYKTDFRYVDATRCSQKYVEEIKSYINSQRIKLHDVTFVYISRSEEQSAKLEFITKWVLRNFDTNISIINLSKSPLLNIDLTQGNVKIESINEYTLAQLEINVFLEKLESKILLMQEIDFFVDIDQIVEAVQLLRDEMCELVVPHSGSVFNILNHNTKKRFYQNFEVSTLIDAKVETNCKQFYGGIFVANRTWYLKIGGENEQFSYSYIKGLDRAARTALYGGRLRSIEGLLFNLSVYHLDDFALSKDYLNEVKLLSDTL
ncbi:hypothetical protein [Pedobacter sp. FW305-3-2-15-E-R2A2]|uniref:hypothetical protein n=1 Tax=Pedobacter sp. FW305-3-2-15-E-R2A2 TaxID=3140251 RepID=UPI003140243E